MQPVLSKVMVMRTVRASLRELALPMTNDRHLTVIYYIAYVSFLERACDAVQRKHHQIFGLSHACRMEKPIKSFAKSSLSSPELGRCYLGA